MVVSERTPAPGGGPVRVLFVCTANICRSAYAELMARHLLGSDSTIDVASAGTHGYEDRPLDPPMADQLRLRGVDPAGFRSRRLTGRMVAQADLVLTAEAAHRQRVLEDHPATFRRVFTLGQLARTVEEGEVGHTGVGTPAGMVRALHWHAPPVDAADDVIDPYDRGEEAAARVAERLDGLLSRILNVLVV